MSLAGAVGFQDDVRRRECSAALQRLSLSPASPHTVADLPGLTFGAADETEIWRGAGVLTAFDGVLYEGGDLRQQLHLPPGACDAEVVAHAWRTWGDLFADKLDGEFALALWSEVDRKLLLARDAMSRRPLFYVAQPDGVCFSSEPRGLRGWRGLPQGFDEQALAHTLAVQPLPGQTMFKGIRSFSGGHTLIIDAAFQQQLLQYWRPTDQPELRLRTSRDYVEALRAHLVRAVERRLPAEGLVATQLSSGFDSSGVTALAAIALARHNRSLVAYTSVPRQRTAAHEIMPDRFDDEWPLAAKVAAMYGNVQHVAIPSDGAPWWESIDYMIDNAEAPPGFIRNARWFYGILHHAASRGAVTMMEGQAGNLTSSYSGGFGLFHLRRQWRVPHMVRSALQQHAQGGVRWSTLIHDAWMPSATSKARIDKLRGRKVPGLFEHSVMRRDFYESLVTDRRNVSAMGSVIEGDRTHGRSWRLSILRGNDAGMMWAAQRRGMHLRREDPTADRRLVELCLSIPDHEFVPQGVRRGLYREALAGILPAELLQERRRGLQSSDFLEHFEPWIPELHIELDLQESSPLVSRVLDLPRMRTMLNDFHANKARSRQAADMMYNYTFGGAIAMGRFLRKSEQM